MIKNSTRIELNYIRYHVNNSQDSLSYFSRNVDVTCSTLSGSCPFVNDNKSHQQCLYYKLQM